jgi:hypothetical protein
MWKGYGEIFFTWCVPGLLLVAFGQLADQLSLTHFGVALLALGLIYYGKAKNHPAAWRMMWLGVAVSYLAFGVIELIRR